MDSLDTVLEALFAQPVHRRVLENGMTILVREDSSSQVSSVQLWVNTGSIHEGPLLGAGVSHYLEHMLFKGTEKRSGKQISREVQSLGGYINAYTTFDRTVYYIDLPSENTIGAIDILADAGFNSTLPEEEVEKERQVILREIDMGKDDPDHLLGRAVFETAYRVHPYKYPVIGYKDIFETVTRDELMDYYKSRYVPNNMVLVITGDVNAEEIFKSSSEMLEVFPRQRLESLYIPEEPKALSKRQQSLNGDVNVSRIGLGFTIPGLRHPDATGLSLLSSILGNGDSSILWQRLRQDRGVVHHVDVSSWNPGTSGLLWVSMMTDPDKKEEALNAFWEEVGTLKDSLIEDSRIQKSLRQAMVGEINNRKTMSGQAARIGAAEVMVGDLDYPRVYLEQLRSVTPEDLKRLLNEYVVSDRLTQITFDPEKDEQKSISSGEVEVRGHEFDEVLLENGARLLFQESPDLPKVHVRVIFKGGALWEKPEQRGISALAANLMTKDTEVRSASDVATSIESLGGSFSEFSGNNTFGLSLEVLPQDLELGLELLEQSLFQLKVNPETFEREREGQIAHIKETLDDVVDFGIRELRHLFFGDFPYSVNAYGQVEHLESLKPEDVQAYLASMIHSGNCVVSVSGLFDRSIVVPRLSELFLRLPSNNVPEDLPVFDRPANTGRSEVAMDREQAVVFQAFPCVGVRQDDLMIQASVLDELFSGMSSQLFERVRDDLGLAYFVGSSRVIGLDSGMLFLYGGTHPSTAEQVLEEMSVEMERIRSGKVEPDELDRIKIRLKAQRRMSLQSMGARAMQAGLNATYDLAVNDWMNFDAKLDAVTIEDLAAFAATYFKEEQRLELIVRPAEA